MISSLRLGNFKCFQDETVPFKRLTLLSGVNGAGKSSVIQALLVLRQICRRGAFSVPQVSLSGDLVDLGRAADILFSSADEDTIWLELEAEQCPLLQAAFLVDLEGGEANWANLDDVQDVIQIMAERGVALFSGGPFGTPGVADFNYLNAERYGPRKAQIGRAHV